MKMTIRQIDHSDMEFLANQYGDFGYKDAQSFHDFLIDTLPKYQENLIIEGDGIPACFVCAFFDGWTYEPHVEFFRTASKRTKFLLTRMFFEGISANSTIGSCVVKCLENSVILFNKVKNLKYVGVIENGDYRGDQHIFAMKGGKV